MFQYVAILVCVLGFAANAYAGNDDTTVRLFNAQRTMAQKGNAQAQYYLGEMYELGLGTAEDTERAIKWYRKAAAQNHPMAKRKLQELTTVTPAEPAQAKVEAPAPMVAPLPQAAPPPKAPAVSAKPAAQSKENAAKEAEAARAAEAKRAAAAAQQARMQAEAKAKKEAAAKERRRKLAEAALARMKADAKKNGIGY